MPNPKIALLTFFMLSTCWAVAQDTLIFENKVIMLVEVLEESETKVIYRKYPPELGNLAHTIKKRFITDILYLDKETSISKFKSDALQLDKKLDIWVTRIGQENVVSGLLLDMNDTTLILKKKSVLFDGKGKNAPEIVHIFPYQQINYIKVRQQNRIVNNVLFGAAIGMAVGTITGLAIFKDSEPCDPILAEGCDPSLSTPISQWSKAWTLGFAGTGVGMFTGGIVGGVKVKIPVGGKKNQFNTIIPQLDRLERALRKR